MTESKKESTLTLLNAVHGALKQSPAFKNGTVQLLQIESAIENITKYWVES